VAVSKRFFQQGMELEGGSSAGSFFYTRDHLGSIREVTDSAGTVRARYAYDPFGRPTRLEGDLVVDFGFGGMFWANEVGLNLTWFRPYSPDAGRWLSRDPWSNAEVKYGPSLYTYANNDPVNLVDPYGLCCEPEENAWVLAFLGAAAACGSVGYSAGIAGIACFLAVLKLVDATKALSECEEKCHPPSNSPCKGGILFDPHNPPECGCD
jgi:RHS repeat-associated protein